MATKTARKRNHLAAELVQVLLHDRSLDYLPAEKIINEIACRYIDDMGMEQPVFSRAMCEANGYIVQTARELIALDRIEATLAKPEIIQRRAGGRRRKARQEDKVQLDLFR
jgi:hypothetical protein